MDRNDGDKKESQQRTKNVPANQESETQQEDKGNEGAEEQEKIYTRNNHVIITRFQLSDKDEFICFSTKPDKHPYHEDDLLPPRLISTDHQKMLSAY